ncbi:MAG: 1-acyl-sn-glycerol-3-phosphate acyltransferase [Acidimicrobiaceae bacterium]
MAETDIRKGLWLYRTVSTMVLVVAKVLCRIEIVGKENVPKRGPYVMAPVHRSNVDFALVSVVTRRRMRYMAKDSLWKSRLLGWFVGTLGAFPVRRGSADREALHTCIELIEQGEPLVMFPEGTRRSGPVVEELFDGPVYVAGRTQVPIVPVGIGGSEAMMPRGSKLLRPVKLTLVVGAPIAPPVATDAGRVSRRAVKELTEKLRIEVQRCFDEAQQRAGRPNP